MSPYLALRRGFARAGIEEVRRHSRALDAKKELKNVAAANIKRLMKLDFVHMRTEFREFTKELKQKSNREFLAMQSGHRDDKAPVWTSSEGRSLGMSSEEH